MFVFDAIKGYFYAIVGAAVVAFLAYVKYLRMTSETQKKTIDRLKTEIGVQREVSKDEVKRAIFEAKHRERAEALQASEITLDDIEREAAGNENDTHCSYDCYANIRM